MSLNDFLIDPSRFAVDGEVEGDALALERTLLECVLLDVRFDAVRSVAWVLIDMKGSLFRREGNTAVVVINGVRTLSWTNSQPGPVFGRAQWSILGWEPKFEEGWSVAMILHPDSDLEISGTSAEFYVGNVPGGDDPPPMFGEVDDRQLAARLAGWSSEFTPLYVTRYPTGAPS